MALKLREKMVKVFAEKAAEAPELRDLLGSDEMQAVVASLDYSTGLMVEENGEPGRSREFLLQALEIRRKLAEANPAIIDYQAHLADSRGALGGMFARAGEPARAAESLGRKRRSGGSWPRPTPPSSAIRSTWRPSMRPLVACSPAARGSRPGLWKPTDGRWRSDAS